MAGWHGRLQNSCLSSMQSSYKRQLALQSHIVRKLMSLLGQSYSLPRRQVEHTWILPAPGSAWVLSLSKKHRSFFCLSIKNMEFSLPDSRPVVRWERTRDFGRRNQYSVLTLVSVLGPKIRTIRLLTPRALCVRWGFWVQVKNRLTKLKAFSNPVNGLKWFEMHNFLRQGLWHHC